jgi:hypothetical protein
MKLFTLNENRLIQALAIERSFLEIRSALIESSLQKFAGLDTSIDLGLGQV